MERKTPRFTYEMPELTELSWTSLRTAIGAGLHVRRQKDFRVSKEEPALATDALFHQWAILEMHKPIGRTIRRRNLDIGFLVRSHEPEQIHLSVRRHCRDTDFLKRIHAPKTPS